MSSATKRTIDEAGWALFADDASTATAEIEEGLLVLEQNPEDGEQINALFRALHTLKGSSGFVGLKALGELAHEAENLVGRVRGRELELTTAMVDVLLRVLDMLRRIVDESGDGPLAEHDGTIAPLCAELRDLSGVDKNVRPTSERLLKDSEELGAKLEACRSACDDGDDGIPCRDLERLALKIHASSNALGFPACAEHSAAFVEALHAGHRRSLRLRWHVLHDKVQGADNGDLVLFDVEDYDDPSGDDAAVHVFLDSVAALLSPLVHELGRTPAGSSDLRAVLTELTELCVVMGYPNLAELLAGVGEPGDKLDAEPSQGHSAVKRFVAELAELERDWASRTRSTIAEGECAFG